MTQLLKPPPALPEIFLDKLPPKIRYGSVSLDLELFGADGKQLHRPRGRFGCLTIGHRDRVYVIRDLSSFEKAIEKVSGARWYIHNGNFDIRHFRRWADIPPKQGDIYRDTLILEKLLYSGYYSDFSLSDLARRYLGIILEKTTRKEFSDPEAELDDKKIQYAALDAWATYHIGEAQESFLKERPDAEHVWTDIDNPAFWAILDFKGIHVNREKWEYQADQQAAKAEEIAGILGFNPGSPQQVKRFFEERGLRLLSTGEEVLSKYKGDKYIDLVLEYRKAKKLASAYGKNFLALIEEDDCVYPSFNIFGAETGRFSSDGPNLQQIPSNADYRSCFDTLPGRNMVMADYSSQEMWIMCEASGDEKLRAALSTGDVHLNIARKMFRDPSIDGKKHPKRRIAKDIAYGTIYGLTPIGLQQQKGIPVEEGEEHFHRFATAYPGIQSHIKRQHSIGLGYGKVSTLGGRTFNINLYFNRWPNNAVNAPIQGTGADMLKLAIGELHLEYGREIPLTIPNHDELVADVPTRQARSVARDIETAMNNAFHKLCPNVSRGYKIAEAVIGKTWADKE